MALTTRHQVLAWDLVEGLQDEAHKGVYFRIAKIYNESFLRQILSITRDAWHSGKIKREDMGRYFMGILKKELTPTALAVEYKVRIKLYGKNSKNNTKRRSGLKKKSPAGKRPKVA